MKASPLARNWPSVPAGRPPLYSSLVVYRATGDERALTRFLKANLPLAESFAVKYLNSDLYEEARAAALRALARAAESYDPSKGSFSHHAHWSFRAELSPLRKQRIRQAPERLTDTGEVEAGSVAGASREQALADILRAARAAGLPLEARQLIVAISDCDRRERAAECKARGVDSRQLADWLGRLKRALAL